MGRRYVVNAVTNYSGLLIPIDFVLENYANQLTNGIPTFSLRGMLRLVTNNALVDFKPQINGATYVEDKRFNAASKPVKQLHYLDTNVDWVAL